MFTELAIIGKGVFPQPVEAAIDALTIGSSLCRTSLPSILVNQPVVFGGEIVTGIAVVVDACIRLNAKAVQQGDLQRRAQQKIVCQVFIAVGIDAIKWIGIFSNIGVDRVKETIVPMTVINLISGGVTAVHGWR